MKSRPLSSIIALVVIAALIAPSALLIAPQPVRADGLPTIEMPGPNFFANIKTSVESTIGAIKSTLIEVHAYTSAAADVAQWINMAVLQPLAFVLSGNLMKTLTAGVIAFVIGKANGTGAPQFAADIMRSFQTVSDSQALAYLNQFGRNSNSPFAYSISSALRTNYLQKTTLAGFWAANMNTLYRTSPNVNGFLAGNWRQGGLATWFSLTTQSQNNPYTLYQNSQNQLSTLVGPGAGGATGARAAVLSWGQGFLSWCSVSDTATQNAGSAATDYASCVEGCNNASGGQTSACVAQCVTSYQSSTGTSGGSSSSAGVNPGDPCYNSDGTPGTIKTPGSTIKATLDKVLGGNQDQITRMGNIGPQINQILGNIGTVLQTVNFAAQILGGPGSGGLFGLGQTSGTNSTTRLIQYQNAPAPLGVTSANVYQGAATIGATGPDMTNRLTQYQSAWGTIAAAANSASTTLASLASFCNTAATASTDNPGFASSARDQATAARAAITSQVAPVLAQSTSASAIIVAAQAMVQKVQGELTSGTEAAGAAYTADIQALQTMPPTMSDVGNVQQEVQSFNTAAASPAGSLAVSGGTVIDRMSLISTNAAALKTSACVEPTATNSSSSD